VCVCVCVCEPRVEEPPVLSEVHSEHSVAAAAAAAGSISLRGAGGFKEGVSEF